MRQSLRKNNPTSNIMKDWGDDGCSPVHYGPYHVITSENRTSKHALLPLSPCSKCIKHTKYLIHTKYFIPLQLLERHSPSNISHHHPSIVALHRSESGRDACNIPNPYQAHHPFHRVKTNHPCQTKGFSFSGPCDRGFLSCMYDEEGPNGVSLRIIIGKGSL